MITLTTAARQALAEALGDADVARVTAALRRVRARPDASDVGVAP